MRSAGADPGNAGYGSFAEDLHGKYLSERLYTIEEAGRLCRAERHHPRCDVERVAFVAESGESGVEPEDYAVAGWGAGCPDSQIKTGSGFEVPCEPPPERRGL